MAAILPTLSSMITPEMTSRLGERFSLSDEVIRRGLTIANSVLVNGMARTSRTAEGKAALETIVGNADSGVLSNLSSVVTGAYDDGGNALATIFGRNLSLITDGAKKATGIDITPMLALCTPVVLALTKNVVSQQNLDADGLAKLLETESRGFNRREPANGKVVKEIFRPLEAQDKLRTVFSDEEWVKLQEGPAYAAALVILADRSGGGGRRSEIEALADAVNEAVDTAGSTELINLLFAEGVSTSTVETIVQAHSKTDKQELRPVLMAPVTEAVELVRAKASNSDAVAYKGLLIDSAQKVASAAKEGGFLGMGGTLISSEEKLAIDELSALVVGQ